MDINILVSYKMVITTQEFRLIQKALRGTLLEEEKAEALALQERMMLVRHKEAAQFAAEAAKSAEQIQNPREI